MEELKIFELIGRVLSGESTDEEAQQLERWLLISPDNKVLFEEIEKVWKQKPSSVKGDSKEAFRRLTDKIRHLEEDSGKIRPIHEEGNTSWWSKAARTAAIFLLLITSSFVIYFLIPKVNVDPAASFLERATPKGAKTNLILPDGTVVWINSDSKLKFPSHFKSNLREVYLEGEAFFDVKKNKNAPFIIHLKDGIVKVLGTSFNIKAYKEDQSIETSVVSGKVAFIKGSNSESKDVAYLSKNQKAIFYRQTGDVKMIPADGQKEIQWKEGKLVFEDTPLLEASKVLERWYGVPVRIENKRLLNCRLTGTFKGQSLKEIISLIALTDEIDFEFKNNFLAIKGKGCY